MKMLNLKKIKHVLLCGVLGLTALLCTAFAVSFTEVKASADTLTASQYRTDGASVRIFNKKSDGTLEETTRSGIRFHVEMGAGYQYNGTTLITEQKNERNDSFKLADGFKTYTLILPSNMLGNADLTVNTPSVMKLDTSEYWYNDSDKNHESVAYVYNIPTAKYTQTFAFRGIICTVAEDGTETVVASTEIANRQLCVVAKQAYKNTLDTEYSYWGKDEAFDKDAAEKIKTFIPTCTITYDVNGVKTTEEVLWGDTPKNVPDFDVPAVDPDAGQHIEYAEAWYNQDDSHEVDVTKAMEYEQNCAITLTHATSAEFKLTGVADYNNFTVGNVQYNGIKVYATLPVDDFADGTKLDTRAVKVVHTSTNGGKFGGLQGVWTLKEDSQMRLVFAFDSSTMKNGDKLTIKGDSVFYADNVMYTLTEDYVIDYACNAQGEEDYGMFLGYLYNSDVVKMENWDEWGNGERVRIRVTFYEDLLINSDFKFVFDGQLPAEYQYPVYTKCNDTGAIRQISQGYYYWNEGEHTILELDGYAYHNNDELFGAPGTKLVQNGGYYIFEEAMYAYFNGSDWVVGAEKGTFGADAFEWKGWNATDTLEARFTTNSNTALKAGGKTDRWFDKVTPMTVEHMSKSAEVPYAVYCTNPDGTVQPINEFMYHGQPAGNGYNHIFALKGFEGTQAGQVVTIVEGTRFWCGSDYFTASDTINFYYNGTDWIANHNGDILNEVTESNFNGQSYNFLENRDGKETNNIRIHFNSELLNGATGTLTLEKGSIKVNGTEYTNLYYHGSGNKILEIRSFETSPIGKNAFEDKLAIEAGTRLWLNNVCFEFKEEMQWIFVGETALRDGSGNILKYNWIINKNTNISTSDIVSMMDATDAGGEVRFKLKDGILSDTFYGFMAMNTNKGIPVVNGTEMPNYAFAYDKNNDLIAVRGGEYGGKLGAYILIPKGSEWWTTQGRLTFLEEIYCVWSSVTGQWSFGFNTEDEIGSVSLANVQRLYNDGNNEIRVQIDKGISDTYYGPIAIKGQATVEKTNGTVSSVFGYWYGGASKSYTADHSLIGFRGTNISAASEGDVFTIKAGTKIIFHTASGLDGYQVIAEDLVYTFVNGGWQQGNLVATATYTANNASVSGPSKVIIGKSYSFTVTPNSGYVVTEVTVNGQSMALKGNNVYTFTAAASNEIVVTTMSTANFYNVTFAIGAGVTVDGGNITSGTIMVTRGESLTFSVAVNNGYRLLGVEGANDNGDGTYTLTPTDDATITISTVKVWNVTYTLSHATASIFGTTVNSGSTITVDQGEYVVTVTPESGYAITGVTNATNNLNGTYTVNVNKDITVAVSALPSIKFGASVISKIEAYNETQYGADLTGVRFRLNPSVCPDLSKITAVHYGMTWNGSVTADVDGSVYHASVFGGHNLFELRFATANLEVGDEFVIEKGTVFSHAAFGYAIEYTERIVGHWTGSEWLLNPDEPETLDLNSNAIKRLISYSDIVDGSAINHTVRIFLTNELFDGDTGQLSIEGTILVNGSVYTGICRYHGSGNKILEISEVDYSKGDVVVIEKGTKIYLGSKCYVFANTLTATCKANGNEAQWSWKLS